MKYKKDQRAALKIADKLKNLDPKFQDIYDVDSDSSESAIVEPELTPEELQLSENNLKGLSCTFETFVTQEGKTQARNVSASGVEGSKVIGTIKSYVAKSQYGFITSPVLETDIYFKAKDLTESWLQDQNLKDCKVIFEVMTMKDGKLQARAISVRRLSGGYFHDTPRPNVTNEQ
eukprot:symbB.v1.2.004164.t1/scaffold235.1/size321457/23